MFRKQLYKTLVVTVRLVHSLSVSIPSRFTTPPLVLQLYLKYLPGILSEFYQCLEDIQYPKNADRWGWAGYYSLDGNLSLSILTALGSVLSGSSRL